MIHSADMPAPNTSQFSGEAAEEAKVERVGHFGDSLMQRCIARAMVADYLVGFHRVAAAAGRQRDRFSLNLAPYPTIRSVTIHRGRLQLLPKGALII